MSRSTTVALILLTTAVTWGCMRSTSTTVDGRIAPLLEGMGNYTMPITTDDSLAQRYFDQGLVLAYGFNHAEAARSFREASRRDSACAMCYWGEALVLGPNINSTMPEDHVPRAYEAIQNAQRHAAGASKREQAYIDALSTRYSKDVAAERSTLDRAYADAMRSVVHRFPDDTDARVLFGEALMDTTPWDYWKENGEAKAITDTILAQFESAMEDEPEHPGANHLYIHAVEAEHPDWAISQAERLEDLVPGAGHLLHMPSHIYIRVGRYHDGSIANERAIAADRSYVTQCHAQGLYPVAYIPHNHHFLWATATMEGRGQKAIEAARTLSSNIDTARMREPGLGTLQHYWVTPLYALVRFGRWDAILEHERPDEDLVYPRAVWHYARAMASIRTHRPVDADRHLAKLRQLEGRPELENVTVWDINPTADIVEIAVHVVAGERAASHGDLDVAIHHLRAGVRLEDQLNYDEPPTWHHPVRQVLGAVLLQADRASEAEQAYREDLERFPENGWSLFGLEKSLRAQDRVSDATSVQRRFDEAWQYADVDLRSSRM